MTEPNMFDLYDAFFKPDDTLGSYHFYDKKLVQKIAQICRGQGGRGSTGLALAKSDRYLSVERG